MVKYKTTEDWVERLLKEQWELRNSRDFGWYDDERELGVNWVLTYASGKHSNLLDQSNYEVIHKDLSERFPEDVFDAWISHYVVGGFDQMLVRVKNEDGSLTDAAYALEDWYLRLDDYPVADEEHYSNLQYEADISYISNHWVDPEYFDTSTLTEGWESRVYSYLFDIGVGCYGEGFNDEEIYDALWALGYTKEYVCPKCKAKWAARYVGRDWVMERHDKEGPAWEAYLEITEQDETFTQYMSQIEEHRLAVRAHKNQKSFLPKKPKAPKAPELRDEDGLVVVVVHGIAICPVCLMGEFDV